uniref:hypothetical protein n=1 Tax=Altererythrobacter segetis TaxID=1104773 RepID=UPI00140BEEE1|nr:hypothetical protein [Altererythrobacter segetis]
MAPGADRRAMLRWAMAAALAPVFASRVGAAAAAGGRTFAPPPGPMTFTRRLERGLPDGKSLVVARTFAVRFSAAPAGWTVTGEQVAATVDAPARIAALAALERQRVETGLFPLALDRAGLILGGPASRPARELDQALALVRQRIGKAAIAADERKELEAFVHAVHEAGTKMSSQFPGDLFAPRHDAVRAEREVALPGGGAGMIEVSFSAVTDPATGLMREARREIVTSIAEDRRLTREDWSLAPR